MEIKKHALTYYVGLGDGWSCALAEGRDGYWDVSVGGVDRGRIPEEAMPTLAALFREAFPADGLTVLPSSNYNEAQFETLREELIDLLGLYPEASVDAILDEVRVVDSGLTHAQEAVDALGAENQAVRKALGISLKDDVVHAAENAKAAAEAAQDYVIRRAVTEEQIRRLKDEVTMLRAAMDQRTKEARDARAELENVREALNYRGPDIVGAAKASAEALDDLITERTILQGVREALGVGPHENILVAIWNAKEAAKASAGLNDTIQRVREALNAHSSDETSRETEDLIRAIWRIVA